MEYSRNAGSLLSDPLLSDKMLLLAGPRQVGKTYLAKQWLGEAGYDDLYYNWEDPKVRRRFRQDPVFFESELRSRGKGARITLDEIHKITDWKTLLKGYFDTLGTDFNFIVTGSARLDMFQKSGDSMIGRYHLLHLWPLTLAEAHKTTRPIPDSPGMVFSPEVVSDRLEQTPYPQDLVDSLLVFSGFPEPLMKQNKRFHTLWQREYNQRLLREDLTNLTRIRDLMRAEHLAELLPTKIASPLSLNSLREVLGCSYDAVRSLVAAFHKLALIFTIRPFSHNIKTALKKEPKMYFYDWSIVPEGGARFENFLAVQLMAFCSLMNDGGWGDLEIRYIRDKQKRETDFLLTEQGRPLILIETKSQYRGEDRNLKHFADQIKAPLSMQVIKEEGIFVKHSDTCWSVSINRFANLFL